MERIPFLPPPPLHILHIGLPLTQSPLPEWADALEGLRRYPREVSTFNDFRDAYAIPSCLL